MTVLDASALLAFLFGEAGHAQVRAVVDTACISAVNLSEVIGRFVRDGYDVEFVLGALITTQLEVVPFTAGDAALTASLLPMTHPLGLSLGDRACLALARTRGAPALTADRAWVQLQVGVDIRLIR